MKQSPHQRKSGWFWVGITLLAITGALLLLFVPTIVHEPEEAAYLIGGLLMLSAIPIAIGVYCMSRGRRQTMEKETLAARAPFAKDAKAEIVIRAPSGFRGTGWFLLVFGMAWFPLAPMVEDQVWGLGFIGGGLFAILLGIWLVGWITKVTFNQPSGYITVSQGAIPVFLWFLRTKRISKGEARSVFVRTFGGTVHTITGASTRTGYDVKVVLRSGKEARLHADWNQDAADHLKRRVLEFGQGV